MTMDLRIFLGYRQKGELALHLYQSKEWQQAKIGLGDINSLLNETHWEEILYIGCFIPSLSLYDQIKEKEREIKTELQLYCPKLNLDNHVLYLFPQLFIS